MTPTERALRARLGAFALHAQGLTNTKPATQAFMDRFEREVDPDGGLQPAERARRAAYARRAYMTRLALKSAQKRGRRAGRA